MIYDGCTKCEVDSKFTCTGEPSVCTKKCGNGKYEPENDEECDDGDYNNKNGCTNGCKKIKGWNCTT